MQINTVTSSKIFFLFSPGISCSSLCGQVMSESRLSHLAINGRTIDGTPMGKRTFTVSPTKSQIIQHYTHMNVFSQKYSMNTKIKVLYLTKNIFFNIKSSI